MSLALYLIGVLSTQCVPIPGGPGILPSNYPSVFTQIIQQVSLNIFHEIGTVLGLTGDQSALMQRTLNLNNRLY